MPSVLLGIILKLEVRGVIFILYSSDSPDYSEDSSVIWSAKISLLKQFSNWLSVWLDLLLTLIHLWLFSDIFEHSFSYLKIIQIFNLLWFIWLIFSQWIQLSCSLFCIWKCFFCPYFLWILSANFTKLLSNSWLYNPDKFSSLIAFGKILNENIYLYLKFRR